MSDPPAVPVRVVVVDDEPDLRLLIGRRLQREPRFTVVGEAADIAGAIEAVADAQPDVVLLDLLLGAEHGRDAVGPLMAAAPEAMIAVLTALPAEQQEAVLRAAGAFTYYEKSLLAELPGLLDEDVRLFRRALAGEDVVAPSATTRRTASGHRGR